MPWKELNLMNQRAEFVLKAVRTDNFRQLCREYGISSKTGYKWQERFLEQGLEGLKDLSRKPASSPGGLDEAIVCEIIRLKNAHRMWGPRKIRALYQRANGGLGPSESSFKRVLQRAGLVEKRRLRHRGQAGQLRSGRRAGAPNEIWTVDFKGWWYDRQGGRCEPLTVRDEFSRYLLELRAVADARTQTVQACFERLFELNGLPAAIRSDNGPPFASSHGLLGLSRLSAWWLALGIDLERGRPGCPQDNSAHERMHWDVERELRRQHKSQQAELDEWRHTFNYERPHETLGMRTPAELYKPSQCPYEGTPQDLSYPGMRQRRVLERGCITWQNQRVFLSTALAGWSVGVQPIEPANYSVWFGRLQIGELDEHTAAFQSIVPAPQPPTP